MDHIEFEKKLMEMLLRGSDDVLVGLRNQYCNSNIESRRFTGAGFLTHFKVKAGIGPAADGRTFQIGDVNAIINGVKNQIGFVLFIKNGYLSMLEGYTLSADFWPSDYSNLLLVYDTPEGKRDYKKLKKCWS